MTQARRSLVTSIFLLFLYVSGTCWVQCEQLGEELTVKQDIGFSSVDDHASLMASDINTERHITSAASKRTMPSDIFTPVSNDAKQPNGKASEANEVKQPNGKASEANEVKQPNGKASESIDLLVSEHNNQQILNTLRPEDVSQLSDNTPTYQCIFPSFRLDFSPETETFQTSVENLSSDFEVLQTSEGHSQLDREIFQTSFQGIFSDSEVFPLDIKGLDSDPGEFQTNEEGLFNFFSNAGMLYTSSENLMSHAGMFQANEDEFLSGTEMFRTNREMLLSSTETFHRNEEVFLLGTEMFQTSSRISPVDGSLIHYTIQEPSLQLSPFFVTSDNHKKTIVMWTPPKDTGVTMTLTGDPCSTDLTTSPHQTLDNMASSPAYSTTVNSSLLKTVLPTAQILTVVRFRKNSGMITTPGFSNGSNYPPSVDDTHCFSKKSWDRHTLLLSFHYFDLEDVNCRYDYLTLSVGDVNNRTELWKKCGSQMIPAEIRNESVVCLHFRSDQVISKRGFNVTYSLLPRSVSEIKLKNGFINCSVIDSYHRSLHFDCNLALECSDRQDEINCSYSSKACPGLVDVEDTCYTNKLRNNITWSAANRECISLNQTLVSPQSPQEWHAFVQVLKYDGRGFAVYLGLMNSAVSSAISSLYRNTWRWSTRTTAFYLNVTMDYNWAYQPACARYSSTANNVILWVEPCTKGYDILLMCQKYKLQHKSPGLPPVSVKNNSLHYLQTVVQCSSKYLVKDYLDCDLESHCHDDLSQEECLQQSVKTTPELFSCLVPTTYSVHYTLLCDYRPDCPDASDESFCKHENCPEDTCRNGQCIKYGERCDDLLQCFDGSDESCSMRVRQFTHDITPPLIVDYDGKGSFTVQSHNESESCPETHFRCTNLDCLPVYLRCNGINDCPDHEDELVSECDKSTCPGFLRCRGSNVCVHPNHTCDGIPHCPQHDDEMLCKTNCPLHCSCQGLAFICTSTFAFHSYPKLRYLHIGNFNISALDLTSNRYLVFLRLSNCELKSLFMAKMDRLHNLQTLDLSGNFLSSLELSTFDKLHNLRSFILSGNPLIYIIPLTFSNDKLENLDLSQTSLKTISEKALLAFPKLKALNLSKSALKEITNKAFNSTTELQYLDLRGTSLKSYPIYMLRHLSKLKHVWANDFKLCCEAALPEGFDLEQCDAPQDNIASCDDLLRSTTYKTFLWIVALFALIGNIGSFMARVFIAKEFQKSSFGLFVLNLSISDFLMGVYLTMIGVADQMFRGQYWWRADAWKQSAACKTAGFLSLLSSEVSAFLISLITIDRFLVLRFPFSSFHFGHISALVACVLSWTIGLVLAGVPLLPFTSHWDLYGQTGICFPLPFTKNGTFPGYFYSFSVMIILNFVLFMLIALGQALIYWSVRTAHKSQIRKNVQSNDAAIARRLIAIVLSDFICWFPTGILGLLTFTGHDIHTDINMSVAIFVMPFNSALNPFLYTLNLVMEKRRKATEARLMLRLQATMQADVSRLDVQPKRQSNNMTVCQTDNRRHDDCASSLGLPRSQPKEAALNQIDKWLEQGLLSLPEIAARADSKEKQIPE